jgi:urease accessory protein
VAVSSSSSGKSPSSSRPDGERGWQAALALGFSRAGGGTILSHRAHHGPLAVQRPFFPEGPDVCHVYVLHPPGGIVGGDQLRVDVEVAAGAHALVTTPAATKAYRTAGATSMLDNRLAVGPGGVLEWLPQETILYDGSALHARTRVDLARGAAFLGLELVCFGLPARNEAFERGKSRLAFEVWRDGVPLVLERGRFDGDGAVPAAAWGLGGAPVTGTLLIAPATTDVDLSALCSDVRARAEALPAGDLGAATVLRDGAALACRYVGPSVERGGTFLREAWALARRAVLGRGASPPRIWAT